ncbi:PWWP domain-containing protein 3 isoform X2 [Hevea brasiliensis]|nr:PWWP domain-containing protein 3 isoform X2 [Hevea brasiliensis]
MKTIETPSRALSESPSLSQGSSKKRDPSTKLSKDASKTSPAKSTRENGTRVSINGKEGLGSSNFDGGLVGTEVSVGREFGGRDTVDLGDNKGGLEDSEINGASSLLKMHESSKSLRSLGSVLDVINKTEKRGFESVDGISLVADICGNVHRSDMKAKRKFCRSVQGDSFYANERCPDGKHEQLSDSKDLEGEDNMGDEEHEFRVGDFVWAKIRSHPWWPGRIYDPLDASDCAKKVKQRDKILVAYFGDGTFAWCNPSQLKPLDDNFLEMSKQSSSKNFSNAVEKAMDEVGRLVDLKMTCSCVPKENLIGFGRTLAVNAGIREGLVVPEGGIDKFSTALFEPAEFLTALKVTAQVATVTNMLEFAVLKHLLSAFYRAKRGYGLPSYYEPKPIPGLDDDTRNWTVDSSNCNSGVEGRIQGPVEEDWLSWPIDLNHGQTAQSMLHKCQGVSQDGHYQRRKQKSLAEIMEGHLDAEAENRDDVLAEEGTKARKAASSAKGKKRKLMGEDMNAEGKNGMMDETKVASLDKAASSSGRKKKKKVSDETDVDGKNEMEDVVKGGENLGKPSSIGKKRKGNGEADVSSSGSSDLFSKPRTRTEKFAESLVAANNKVSSVEVDGSQVKKENMKSPLSRGGKKKGSSNIEDADGWGKNEGTSENTVSAEKKLDGRPGKSDKALERIKEDSLPRERKRSKYLSPPYTNLNKAERKKEIEEEPLKVSNEAQLGERLSGERFQKKPYKEPGSNNSGPQTQGQDQSKIDLMIVKTPASEVLSKIRSAALSPQYLKETSSHDMVEEFFSAFRSSIYSNGSDYEMHIEHLPGRKKKSQKFETGQNQSDHSSPELKSHRTKTKKSEEAKLDKVKGKQAVSAPEMKTKEKESEGAPSGATLFVSFGPGSSLPSKNDLLKIYGKFGALNKDETDMLYTNYCARVVFLKSTEAEEAFNNSQLSSPFGSASVTFRLRYRLAETKTQELKERSSSKPSSLAKEGTTTADTPSASQSSGSDVSQLNYIKQKLEMIRSLLETSEGKISQDLKSILECEMKVLVEKV